MMKACFLLLLFSTAALAEEPSEEAKVQALKRAYQLNNNSMVRWGSSIDLTNEPIVVKTEKIIPIAGEEFNDLDAAADINSCKKSRKPMHCR
jgi:hypothetical protein